LLKGVLHIAAKKRRVRWNDPRARQSSAADFVRYCPMIIHS
jgi:hypothetical protein